MTTPQELDERFRAAVNDLTGTRSTQDLRAPVREGSGLTGAHALDLFDAQLASRHLDLAARWLRSFGEGFYTIGSSGHEGNAAVAAALRPTDPALLHYRSGAFYCARAGQVDGAPDGDGGVSGAIRDVLRGLVASAAEPIAGGRHKVFGSSALHVIPTTTGLATHLPRAVGLACAIETAAARREPDDAVVVASFGDASVNHAAAQAAFSFAGMLTHTGQPLPLLFVCEDNGLGHGVRSPQGWVASALESRPGLRYLSADGCDLVHTFDTAVEAVAWVRANRRPALLHLGTVRLMGHTGADVETAYRGRADITQDLARDPLVGTAALLVRSGLLSPAEVLSRYDDAGWRVRRIAEEVLTEPKLASAAEVVAPQAPRRPSRVSRWVTEAASLAGGAGQAARLAAFGGELPEHAGGLTLAQSINAALTDVLVSMAEAMLFGADVAAKGGVYGVTAGLRERFGADRVFDTPPDPTSVLGLALGAGLAGLLPIPEIQYLAHLHSAADQLRGEAASMQFFSTEAYRNPMVIRVAGLAHQEECGGGHPCSDNGMAALRDIPGIVVALPSCAADAAPMLRTCLAAAAVDGSVCVFLEPVALYHARHLHQDGDNGWLAPYAAPAEWSRAHLAVGRAGVYGAGEHLTIITFGNGVPMSVRAAARLAADGIGARVVDLRWLAPLPVADLVREASATGRVLVVDETRRSGGVGEGVLAALVDAGYVGVVRRIASVDSFLPLGNAAKHLLVTEDAIIEGARSLLTR